MVFAPVGLLPQASTVEPAVWHERQQQGSSFGQHAGHPIHDKVNPVCLPLSVTLRQSSAENPLLQHLAMPCAHRQHSFEQLQACLLA